MSRIARIATYLVCGLTFASAYSFVSTKMEYTRMRSDRPQQEAGRIYPASGFYGKIVFLTEGEKNGLDMKTYLTYGLFGLSLLGIATVNFLDRRTEKRR